MLTLVRVLTVLFLIAGLSFGQTAKRSSATPIKAAATQRSTYKAPVAKATRPHATAIAKTTYRAQAPKSTRIQAQRVTRTPVRRSAPRAAVQMQPSQDRYREIQQALIDKGYLQGEASGAWDASSVNAWNRFKQDQNLRGDSRLDSRTLIALGLGPKKDSYISVPPAVAAEQAVGSQDQQ